jgi:DNA helicase-2/ATP-dependent DNA helicase PcrA
MPEYLDRLNTNQRKAATIIDGYELMLAGAGTGKTHTLISRVAYMIDSGIEPSSILLLTFTKKAAQEMKDRLKLYIGERGEQVVASTFHSFIWSTMRAYGSVMNVPPNARVLSTSENETVLRSCCKAYMERLNISDARRKEFPGIGTMADILSYSVNAMLPLNMVLQMDGRTKACALDILTIYEEYEAYKERMGYYSFDDLLTKFLDYMEQHPDYVRLFNQVYPYVMCDEYQDTNLLQDRILDLMTQESKNLCVVGDDNQSIYAFRAANVANILTFEKRHPGCQVVPLLENYRSTQPILDVSNALMESALEGIPKKLSGFSFGVKPSYHLVDTEAAAARLIVDQIQSHVQAGGSYRDNCVLVRKANTSYRVEQMLSKEGIPYRKYGGRRFTEEHVVQLILCLLRVSENPKDELAWRTVLLDVPGLGASSVEKLIAALPEHGLRILTKTQDCIKNGVTVGVKLAYVATSYPMLCQEDTVKGRLKIAVEMARNMVESNMKRTKSLDTKERMNKWLAALPQHEAMLYDLAQDRRDVAAFVDELLMEVPVDSTADEVCVSTIHSAKGLEWENVFLLHPVENVFLDAEASLESREEERRVLYVAMTRAKRHLQFVQCRQMLLNGRQVPTMMSSFLSTENCLKTLEMAPTPSKSVWTGFDNLGTGSEDWDV